MHTMAANRLAAAYRAIDLNTYQIDGQPFVSVRLPSKNFKPTVRAARFNPDDLKLFLRAGGGLSMFWGPYGPCAKITNNRSVIVARWLKDAKSGEGVTFEDGNKGPTSPGRTCTSTGSHSGRPSAN